MKELREEREGHKCRPPLFFPPTRISTRNRGHALHAFAKEQSVDLLAEVHKSRGTRIPTSTGSAGLVAASFSNSSVLWQWWKSNFRTNLYLWPLQVYIAKGSRRQIVNTDCGFTEWTLYLTTKLLISSVVAKQGLCVKNKSTEEYAIIWSWIRLFKGRNTQQIAISEKTIVKAKKIWNDYD